MSSRASNSIQVSGGFLLLVAWFAVVNGWKPLAEVLSAVIAHELGHWVLLYLTGASVLGVRINVLGAVIETDCRRLSYGKELAVVLAGPAMNFLCAVVMKRLPFHLEPFIGAHLILGIYNLLPVWPLDGGRALYLLSAWLLSPEWAVRISTFVGRITAFLLALGLVWLMVYTGGSLWLLPAAGGLLAAGFTRRA